MANAFQNRLVGTIIIVALAVIFLPEILDGEKRRSQDRFETVPEAPPMNEVLAAEEFPFEEVQSAVTRQVEIVNETAVDENTTASGEETTATSEIPDQADDAYSSRTQNLQSANNATSNSNTRTSVARNTGATSPEALMEPKKEAVQAGWVVQLGSFRHQKNVRDLLRKLEQAGYRTFTRPIQTSSGQLTKVFVGPDLDQSKLQKAVPHLKEVTGLSGRLTPFTVE